MDSTEQSAQNSSTAHRSRRNLRDWVPLRIASMTLLITAAILILALVILSAFGGPIREAKYVKKDNMQAVFLNNGQVYFGNITNLNGTYVRLANIYYLRQSQAPQSQQNTNTNTNNNNLSLVKLGCEVHGP